MKILLISNYIYDRQNSMQLFSNILELKLRGSGHKVRVIKPEPIFGALQPSYKRMGKWLGYIDKFAIFPEKIKKEALGADIVHICDHSSSHYVKYLNDVPCVVTCNDMFAVRSALGEFSQNPTAWTGRCLQRMIVKGLKLSTRIVCISKATSDDVVRICGISPDLVSIIYMGLNYDYSPMNKAISAYLVRRLQVPFNKPFFLHVGKDNRYKNRIGVLQIFRKVIEMPEGIDHNIVFAGAPLSEKMSAYIRREGIGDRIITLANPDQEDLRALYSTATALIFPSMAEGFGWPVIEAQACGCPVFTTNRAPMTEAGGDAAVYFDPDRPEEAARIIGEGLKDAAGMRERGFANVKRFSTDAMVDNYIKIYEEMMKTTMAGRGVAA